MKAKILDTTGKEKGTYELPKEVFELPWNADLVHQVVVSMQANARQGNAHTKFRGEVSGGGKKPWKQKGTGKARHGSTRSPLWIGGGVTHGPRSDKNYEKKINKKMKRRALYTILSQKAREGEIVLLENLPQEAKTKNALGVLANLSKVKGLEKINYEKGRRALIYSPEKNASALRMFSNVKSVRVEEARNANPLQLLTYKYVVLIEPEKSIQALTHLKAVKTPKEKKEVLKKVKKQVKKA